ncbi:MAG: hypothetical protein EOP88_26830, partial [Verrucomicrobiaceae bacterium]
MKSRVSILAVAAAGCLIGFLGVRLSASSKAGVPATGPAQVIAKTNTAAGGNASTFDSPASADARVPDKRHTFTNLLKDAPVIFERKKPYKDLERMDAGQLKTVIVECLQQVGPDAAMPDRQAASGVMGTAVRELYKREGDKALEWAAAEVPEAQRSAVLSELLVAVAKDSPDTMKEWADRYRGQYGDQWAERFNTAAVVGAIERGAAELLRVRELLGTRTMPFSTPDFPDDFDFHLFITKSKPDFGFQEVVAQWAARDKEAAWNGVKEVISNNEGSGATYFGAMFRGVLAMEGDEKASSWLAAK